MSFSAPSPVVHSEAETGFTTSVEKRAFSVKATRYFEEQVLRKRPYLKRTWCEKVLAEPIHYEAQPEDDRIRFWGFVPELGTFLRVITLEDGETVHNAFPNRNFRP